MKNNKVVLAFSGGLDTSYSLKYLVKEKQMNVYSAIVNTGGFSASELKILEEKAFQLGAIDHVVLEKTIDYYQHIVKYLIFGNVLKNNTYPLSVSSERVFQAIALAQYAKEIGAAYIAHGSTGAGNDQVRFDLIFQLIAPEIEIITLIRDKKLSRKEEIDYLKENGFTMSHATAEYSINKGLWGTSVGGKETLTSHLALPESAFPSQLQRTDSQIIEIEFFKGEVGALNGKKMNPVELIQQVDKMANEYAIGRDTHVGDTIIGIKGRVGFEAAAASILIKAHHSLEKHTLSKWQLQFKEQLSSWYGMFIHEAQYLDPVMRNMESFLEDSQKSVSGTVSVELHPYRFVILGIKSENDLMNPAFGSYGETNRDWNGEDVKGFTKIMANSLRIYNKVNPNTQW
ncbi:MAG TPA: argininosuccinate synthase [Bacteroidales bacterium]|nr:argininosuccinate synthase [Bacteroidales bacterium]